MRCKVKKIIFKSTKLFLNYFGFVFYFYSILKINMPLKNIQNIFA
nr:MAG TPA: hypothetical protein [Bacteriophage sp.]